MWGQGANHVFLSFRHYGTDEGLSQNTVTDLYQDKRGFLWVGTPDGLNRYDGEAFETMWPKGSGLSNNVRGLLSEDERGRIWYANESGVFRCDPASFDVKYALLPENLRQKGEVRGLYYDRHAQKYWIFIQYIGVVSFHLKNEKFDSYETSDFQLYEPSGFSSAYLGGGRGIAVDNLRQIWIPLEGAKGVSVFDLQAQTFRRYLGEQTVLGVYAQGKNMFIVTPGGILTSYSADRPKFPFGAGFPTDFGAQIRHVAQDAYQRLWISTAQIGLWGIQTSTGAIAHLEPDTRLRASLPSKRLTDLHVDHTGNLWVGTVNNGLGKADLKPTCFNGFPSTEGGASAIEESSTTALCEGDGGLLWFGTADGKLFRLDTATQQLRQWGRLETGMFATALFKIPQGPLCVGHQRGLAILDEKKGALKPLGKTVEFGGIRHIAQDNKGHLIAATDSGLIMLELDKGTVKALLPEKRLACKDVVQVPDGSFWAASATTGLLHWRLEENGVFAFLERQANDYAVHDLLLATTGVLWLGTNQGLAKFDPQNKQLELVGDQGSISPRTFLGLLEDHKGHLWCCTNRGLSDFDPVTGLMSNYTTADGLQSIEFNPGAHYKGASGTLYVGSNKGINWFKEPMCRQSDEGKPKIAAEHIYVNGDLYFPKQNYPAQIFLNLPLKENNLAIQFAALDFTRPEANKIQFHLTDKNGLFSLKPTTQKGKTVHFPNLQPGNYVLTVMAGNVHGQWSDPQSIEIRIRDSAWHSFGRDFVFFAVVFALLVGLYFHKRGQDERFAALQKAVEADRKRIAKDMHDEIGSGLTRVALLTEMIDRSKIKDAKTESQLTDIAQSSRKLVHNISEIVWAMNPQNNSLDHLLAYIREQSYFFFEPFESVDYEIFFPAEVPTVHLDNRVRRNLFYTVKESLNNALKHADASRIELHCTLENHTLRFDIADNGKGLVPSTKKKKGGFGLPGLQQRIQEIGGTIEWISQPGAGTRVVVTMPLPKATDPWMGFEGIKVFVLNIKTAVNHVTHKFNPPRHH